MASPLPLYEEWKKIPRFPNYRVSNLGEVCSVKNNGTWKKLCLRKRKGSITVHLWKNGEGVTIEVHRLALLSFIGKPKWPNKVCRHLDGNPHNNKFSNLCWGTMKENYEDARRHGTAAIGEKCKSAYLTEEEVREIRKLGKTGLTHRKIAQRFNVDHTQVTRVINRVRWNHVQD